MNDITAAIIIIGNEILSGRTLDLNTQHIATELDKAGIILAETRIVLDNENHIIKAVNDLRQQYDYIFTTGGIGPTHDDITASSIALAFNKKIELNQEAFKIISTLYSSRGVPMNKYNTKMAYLPEGCELIYNPLSGAPGFRLENVYVFAGIPKIMAGMLSGILPQLKKGPPVLSKTITAMVGESLIAEIIESSEKNNPAIEIGSYPFKVEHEDESKVKHGTNIVIRCKDARILNNVYKETYDTIKSLGHLS